MKKSFTLVELLVMISSAMSMFNEKLDDSNYSDGPKKDILSDGITTIENLLEKMDDDPTFNFDATSLEVEDKLSYICDDLLGRESTKKIFAAMSIVEIITHNHRDRITK